MHLCCHSHHSCIWQPLTLLCSAFCTRCTQKSSRAIATVSRQYHAPQVVVRHEFHETGYREDARALGVCPPPENDAGGPRLAWAALPHCIHGYALQTQHASLHTWVCTLQIQHSSRHTWVRTLKPSFLIAYMGAHLQPSNFSLVVIGLLYMAYPDVLPASN